MEGKVIGGKFRLGRIIGEGGMGAVYEAEHVDIRRRVAIKVLRRELQHHAEALARFRQEAQIAGSLGEDNICEVLDIGVTPEGDHYLVMPLLRGASLAEIIERAGSLPVKQAIDITAQVLSALAAAHNAGVIHRDLKPDNVFITRVGDREGFVKVLDFGISKVVSESTGSPNTLTRTGTIMGTPYYMAPEQAWGSKEQDHRVDLYAAGVMLYEMLTGRRPFEGDNFNELVIKIATAPFPPPSSLRPEMPLELESLILRAMEKDREARFPDALSMRAELTRARMVVDEPTGRVRISLGSTNAGVSPCVKIPAAGIDMSSILGTAAGKQAAPPPLYGTKPGASAASADVERLDDAPARAATPFGVALRTREPFRLPTNRPLWIVGIVAGIAILATVAAIVLSSSGPSTATPEPFRAVASGVPAILPPAALPAQPSPPVPSTPTGLSPPPAASLALDPVTISSEADAGAPTKVLAPPLRPPTAPRLLRGRRGTAIVTSNE